MENSGGKGCSVPERRQMSQQPSNLPALRVKRLHEYFSKNRSTYCLKPNLKLQSDSLHIKSAKSNKKTGH